MADTKRSSEELLNLFRDGQAKNAITEQAVRDLIVSGLMPHARVHTESNTTETEIDTVDVYVKVEGNFQTSGEEVDFDISLVDRIAVYTGRPDRHVHVLSTIQVTSTGSNKIISFQIYHTPLSTGVAVGLAIPVARKISTGGDVGAVAVFADVVIKTGDKLELRAANLTDSTNLTVLSGYMSLIGTMH